MMEEIDLFDSPNPFGEEPKSSNNAPAAAPTSRKPASTSTRSSNSPLRLPRTTGNSRGKFLRDTLQSQIPTTEQLQNTKKQAGKQLQNTKKQAGKVLNRLGNQLNKLNLGKLIDKMEQDQGLADSLEKLNERMKEEVERQEIRREAEELTIKVITDHLGEFLTEHPQGTYEEWIQDLHPENANMGQLLSDIQQIDERFYVMESDHRRLWNEAIEKQQKEANNQDRTSYEHRIVKPRTQIWEKAPGTPSNDQTGFSDTPQNDAAIDLLSASNPQNTTTDIVESNSNGVEEIDFFAPVSSPTTDLFAPTTGGENTSGNSKSSDPFQDLLQF